jgi:hypothetical protein
MRYTMLRSALCICVALLVTGLTGAADAAPKNAAPLASLCGDDTDEIDGLPVDRVRPVINPNDAQRAALDDLANASKKASETIAAACSGETPTSAPAQLAAMQQRIEANLAAIKIIQPPLDKLFSLLDDEQRAKVTALTDSGPAAQPCEIASALSWPADQIERAVHPDDAQRQTLAALNDAQDRAADMLKASCPDVEPLTAPARLLALQQRLETSLQAVKLVRTALDAFYATLNEDQKAAFDAIGGEQTTKAPTPSHAHETHHSHHIGSIRRLIRRFISIIR